MLSKSIYCRHSRFGSVFIQIPLQWVGLGFPYLKTQTNYEGSSNESLNWTIIYKSKCCVCPVASLCSLTPWAGSRHNATCASWQAFLRLRRLQLSSSPIGTSSCSSYWQQQNCSKKLICSTDELHQSTHPSANMGVLKWMKGRFKEDEEEEHGKIGRDQCVCVYASVYALT